MTDGAGCGARLIIFEVLAVLGRDVRRRALEARRAGVPAKIWADLSVDLLPTLPLRARARELRENLTVADALFVALAEALDEPLATKNGALARAAADHAGVPVIEL